MPVLIVDDDPAIREFLTTALEDEGHLVVSASNGEEALDTLRGGTLPPCLILLDLMMPIMNGWEFLNQRDSDPTLTHIPVVVITAVNDRAKTIAAQRAAGYIPKPIDIEILLDTVNRYCQ